MDIFAECAEINNLLRADDKPNARNKLIKLLDHHQKNKIPYTPLLNHLIRESGLFPYIEPDTSGWEERFVHESFKADIGLDKPVTLHSEQSLVLKHLLEGANLAVSAPTSFGKSLIIDAFIAIKKPTNVLIIVPTIALTDETRRRLSKKFSRDYKIITTTDVGLSKKNIFIFPQERAVYYSNEINNLDLLVVDEFYKASKDFDQERSPSLLKAMLKLGSIARQRYYLAPNISKINENPFTEGMIFLSLDFNTVFLEKHELYHRIKRNLTIKNEYLINIIKSANNKSLIYAGSYSNVGRISTLLIEKTSDVKSDLLAQFSNWLASNYDPNWELTALVKRGTGIHTGQLHRSLAQIQVRLFEEKDGLKNIISTSSIIEGVNTSAENVIIWSNKNGNLMLNDFTYKNIIGRGGRMFKHFVGNIYILEEPPRPSDAQLDLSFPEEILADIDEITFERELTKEQIAKIIAFREEMASIIGKEAIDRLQRENMLITGDIELITDIALEISRNKNRWRALAYLNSSSTEHWDWILMKVLKFMPGIWDCPYGKFIEFIKILSRNWELSIPELLDQLDGIDINIAQFFRLERNATFKLSALLSDINVIQKEILHIKTVDITPFISLISRAFLPSCVLALEEYGLPRMIAKKIHASGLIDFSDEGLKLHDAINTLNRQKDKIFSNIAELDKFDRYVLDYFFDGITTNQPQTTRRLIKPRRKNV